jgi:hypothetical protein
MRFILPLVLVPMMAFSCAGADDDALLAAASHPERTVVLELFTSEGCSSCPPADDLLRTLVATQPIRGARIIALSEHVEYWNSLGWRDRFSAPVFTSRQADYQAKVFRTDAIYTPQAVVDGTLECIGSDKSAVRRAIERAAKAEKADVQLKVDDGTPQQRTVHVEISVPLSMTRTEPADVVVAAIEDGLVTDVRLGENRGRTLAHDSVVRAFHVVGPLAANERKGSFAVVVPIGDDWNASRLRIVAFLQERSRRTIIGAASIKIGDGRPPATEIT